MFKSYFKILLFGTWFILIGLLINRDFLLPTISPDEKALLQQAREESYYGIWFQDQRIGYVVEQIQAREDGTYLLRQKAQLRLRVLTSTQFISMDLEADLAPDLRMRDFQFTFSSPNYSMEASGKVEGRQVHFTLDTGRSTIKDTITLAHSPLPPLNQRPYLLQELTKKGAKVKITSFDPVSLTGKEAVVEYLGREKILVRRTVYNAHHFVESHAGMRINFWLNDEGGIIKEESPTGFVFIAEPKFKATAITIPSGDLLDSVAVNYSGNLPTSQQASVTYRLVLPAGVELDLDGGRQTLGADHLLTLRRESLDSQMSTAAASELCQAEQYLQPSRYVQADHPDIRKMAQTIVGSQADPTEQVKLLATWVFTNLEKRSVLGVPDALTTLRTKRGDCNEHASLFAALARSLKIPTTMAAGVTLYRGAFYYHAWNEVCVNNRWLSLDTTASQLPADLTHIRLARGDLDQQLKIGALLGKLQIDILPPDQEPK